MNKSKEFARTALRLALTLFALSSCQDGEPVKPVELTYANPDDFPGQARSGAISFQIDNKGYFGMGHGHNDLGNTIYFQDFWEYDLSTGKWTQKKDFPGGGRSGGVGFAIGHKGYAGTGASASRCTRDFWEYDPINDEWTQKADFPQNVGWAVGFSIGASGYVGTGIGNCNAEMRKDFYEYDPVTNQWTQKSEFPGLAVDQAVGFSIKKSGYIGVGLRAESWLGHTRQLWEYDPANDTWLQKNDCPSDSPMFGSIAFTLNSKAYIGLGGYHGDRRIWEFDPASNEWKEKENFTGKGRLGCVAFTVGNWALIGTGASSTEFYKDFVKYIP